MVDDDEDALALYSKYIQQRRADWEVVCMDSPQHALNVLDRSFHAVVLDEMMPGMRGAQVLQEIRSRADVGSICVVMLTATDDPDVIVETIPYKVTAYLRKMKATAKEDLYNALARELSKMNSQFLRPVSVFLCHSHVDKPTVRELYYRLKRDLVEPWLDEEKLLPGQDWELEIRKAVKASDIVAVCLSHQASRPGYLHKEISYALDAAYEQPEGAIYLIPLLLEPCEVPLRLTKWEWINLGDAGWYDRLIRAIDARAKALGLSAGSQTGGVP